MVKTILITGATDGIGLETARILASDGHRLLLHGRNASKLEQVREALSPVVASSSIESYLADLSSLAEVRTLANSVKQNHTRLDVLINNAGVFQASQAATTDQLDVRFAVNCLAPYLLTQKLSGLLGATGRVVNLSSAAQATVDLRALSGQVWLSAGEAYAQSKLALTSWSRALGLSWQQSGPSVIAVNPGSLLGSKMVREAYGIAGGDIQIGAEILCRAALSEQFSEASGLYFDNDSGDFGPPHPDAMNPQIAAEILRKMDAIID